MNRGVNRWLTNSLLNRHAGLLEVARCCITYHGVLAPGSPLRSLIVPGVHPPAPPDTSQASSSPAPSSKFTWAQLLLRVFGEDVLRCPACGGRRHMISTITDPATIRRILGHFGLRTEPYAFDPARPPPQAKLDW